LLTAVLTSISCGIIGTYIVSKRLVFISGGITHTSFGGIGMGYFLGINPLIGAAVFSILSALGIEFMSKKTEVREDSAIAIMWSFGMAVGIIFIFITPGYAPNLMTYLFGSILTVTKLDLIISLSVTILVIIFFLSFYKVILFVSFDPDFAKARQINVGLMNYILITLVALTIVMNIKVAGIILIISLLTIPQASANLFFKDFKKIIFFSIIIGLTGSISGLILSYYINIPSGATIIFTLVLIFLILRLIRSIKIMLTQTVSQTPKSHKA
ncbi:MAG: metal ABC transporter permease, partial [Bacteroidales bacterium]|nr:metal ABC transporter permease [Bacteroidales bacterium]